MIEELRKGLIPLYEELPFDFNDASKSMFCVQWGKFYPKNEKKIMFVGKAVNGWFGIVPINIAFGNSEKRIFDLEDQMNWVTQKDENGYLYPNRSAFWRTVKNVSQSFYPQEDWYENVSWNNLYKIAPREENNPTEKDQNLQLECCEKILSKEIEVLKPKVVVMLTSGWEHDFIISLNNNIEPAPLETIEWGGSYSSTLYKIDGTAFITSQHPQGKNESEHVDAIKTLIEKYGLL